MPVPKRKQSRKRRDQRSANKHITVKSFSVCPQEGCDAAFVSHRVCSKCGFYRGNSILTVKKAKNSLNAVTSENASQ
jgi:large subunit ribosomal protein L32